MVEAEYVIPRDDTRSVDLRIEVPNDINMHSGECELVHARAKYDAYRGEASVDYTLDESGFGQVALSIDKTSAGALIGSWDICVSTGIPMAVALQQGTGDADINLAGVQLRGLDVQSGTGDFELDLGDAYLAEATMKLQTGTGDVEFDADRIAVVGASSLRVQAGTGDLDVLLPPEVGLEVHVKKGTGDLSVAGLERVGEAKSGHYQNALWTTAENRLSVEISAGTGDVTLVAG